MCRESNEEGQDERTVTRPCPHHFTFHTSYSKHAHAYLLEGVLEIDVLGEADLLVKQRGSADGGELVALYSQAPDHSGRSLRGVGVNGCGVETYV